MHAISGQAVLLDGEHQWQVLLGATLEDAVMDAVIGRIFPLQGTGLLRWRRWFVGWRLLQVCGLFGLQTDTLEWNAGFLRQCDEYILIDKDSQC